ncbi:putative transcription factor C2H2 family [Helianthus annuus]|uniref:RING-type E3 ubiquitin transferase n=1 Tax=Helianthus annuus TaxID=4232 RepID=A0A251VF07_HELAN|nr:E3 ubiquitin-protein ligase CIP8 [Helianthus annuus]KAF5818084.1 putative transcription factor C2H2 family [Helianthus annuus]KAJ0604443.1 putative transcription factor C2H2 family [Helianthus annuus]
MAEVSYLHLHEHDDEHDDAFDFLCRTDRNPPPVSPNDDHSILFDRENQVNFVIDMFHQSVEQSQSRASDGNDRRSRGNDLGVLGLGFDDDSNNGDDNSGFMFADCWDDFFVSRTDNLSNRSEYLSGGFPGLGTDSDFLTENQNPIPNANDDLEWEEIDDHEALNMISGSEPDEAREPEGQPNGLEWEVLLNTRNLEPNPDLADYNYTDYEMLFGQFLDSDSSSSGRPPASITVVENLSSVVITDEGFENNTVCAVCKDEIGVGLIAKKLPCDHLYHGDCILPWLGIRNTCPVCRYELLTDDPEYERRKAESGASD